MLSDEEIISLNRMKLFARSSDLSIVNAKDMNIVVTLVENQQKEIEELKEKNKNLNWYFENQKDNFVHKDKIKAKIEEVKDGTFDAEIILHQLLEKE